MVRIAVQALDRRPQSNLMLVLDGFTNGVMKIFQVSLLLKCEFVPATFVDK
jgi:hypothetical protein